MFNSTETKKLKNKKVALIATDGFEEAELMEPKKALEDAGAEVEVISLKAGKIRSWKKDDWGIKIDVDRVIADALPNDYDALLLPGGVINADKLRQDKEVIRFISQIIKVGKPISAICHAAWSLIETGMVRDRTMTSWPSLKTDLKNAGVIWLDQEVVVDSGWVTSRKPDDIPAFNKKMIEEIAEGKHYPNFASHSSESLTLHH